MDQKLREFLRKKGVSEDDIDALERGEVPDDPDVLRKRDDDSPLDRLRKSVDRMRDDDARSLEKLRQIADQMREIKEVVERIEKESARRAAFARGVALFNAGHNGADRASKGILQ
jgi:hypothetical protein